jgi:signal transduction histidine kinase/DNA-binding response OmpR family regulator
MKLRQFFLWFSLAAVLALTANAVFLWMIQRAFQGVVAEQDHRQRALALTNALRHETELLTRLVRAYTSTSETRYLMLYYDILAIRQGEKPLPEDYVPGAYWDMVLAGEIAPRFDPEAPARALSERMRALGFSPGELDALARVTAATEALKAVEQIAFAATQGLYDPAVGDFVSDAPPDLAFANQQVNSQAYNQLRSELGQAVLALNAMVDARTSASVSAATAALQRWIYLAFASLLGTLLMVLAAGQVIRFQVLQPIQGLSRAAARLAAGDYSTRIRGGARANDKDSVDTPSGVQRRAKGGVQELIALGATFDGMAESIEEDIARRHRTQQDLEAANRKAEEATRAKSMFLANMSHEIRTPMNAIIGMAHLALQTELNPRQRGYVENVQSSARSLLGIINDILDFSKVEAGKLELEQAPFVLEEVIGNALSLLRQRAHEREIELLFEVADARLLGADCRLLGDALRLSQILTNLLSNAVKFTHQGWVKLSVERVAPLGDGDDNGVVLRFCVRDTGIGLSREQRDRLFQEFTQADGSTTRKYGGTGLGLTICKKLVELMGGEIWVESQEGQGAGFFFTARFPIAGPGQAQAPALPDCDSLRLLVVDDRAEAREVLAQLLEVMGVGGAPGGCVHCAESGNKALRMITDASERGQPYDWLLLDWVMPGMDGGGLLRRLRGLGLERLPRVVVVSAYDSNLIHASAQALGVDLFLPKPVLPENLRRLIKDLTGQGGAPAQEPHAVEAPRLDGMRVLLVEDNALNQQLAVELMEARGVKVRVAGNGADALERLAEVPPDHYQLVLMDLQMPVMDGYEATRRLRADPRYFDLPVVAMTAHAMVEERERCAAIGMTGHLGKPVEPEDLYALLRRHAKGSEGNTRSSRPEPLSSPSAAPADLVSDEAAQALPRIAHLDTAAGLRRAGGRVDLYRQLLAGFVKDFADCEPTFRAHFAAGRWREAEQLAHTLKGLSATLGAVTVQPAAVALERACKKADKGNAERALSALLPPLSALLAALQRQGVASEPSQFEAGDALAAGEGVRIPECLPTLQHLLHDCDGDAMDLWARHRDTFARLFPPDSLRRIDAALGQFDFDTAAALLDELAATLS